MNFQFYVEKLKTLTIYKKFIKENSGAFPCSAFFIIDKEGSDNKQHFDFYIKDKDKLFSIRLEDGKIEPVELVGEYKPSSIDLEVDFDFNKIEALILKKMEADGIKNKIQKLLFSFQEKNGKHFLIGTVFISSLGMLKVMIDTKNMKIDQLEKKSFFDIMKVKRGGKRS